MKKLLPLFLLLITTMASAQVLKYDDISNWSKKQKVEFDAYEASNGHVYRIGEYITLGMPERRDQLFMYVHQQAAVSQPEGVGLESARLRSEIIKFKITGTRRAGYEVVAVGKTPYGFTRFYILIEKGLNAGEVQSEVMSREVAIAKLKEGKDLMEMDMMSQEDFEALKKELTPIIQGE